MSHRVLQDALRNSPLPQRLRFLVFTLLSYAGKPDGSDIWPSDRTLMSVLGIGDRALRAQLQEAKELGVVHDDGWHQMKNENGRTVMVRKRCVDLGALATAKDKRDARALRSATATTRESSVERREQRSKTTRRKAAERKAGNEPGLPLNPGISVPEPRNARADNPGISVPEPRNARADNPGISVPEPRNARADIKGSGGTEQVVGNYSGAGAPANAQCSFSRFPPKRRTAKSTRVPVSPEKWSLYRKAQIG